MKTFTEWNAGDLRTEYKIVDDQGAVRGSIVLSELEMEVMQNTLKKGDLMISKFNIVK